MRKTFVSYWMSTVTFRTQEACQADSVNPLREYSMHLLAQACFSSRCLADISKLRLVLLT
jgi:hypothetical protein